MKTKSCPKCGHYILEIEGAELCPLCGGLKISDSKLYDHFYLKNLEILWRAERRRRRTASAYYIWEEDY